MFYSGSLQGGIVLAVSQAKAVVCFVRDDEQTSSTWEDNYFTGDEEFTRLLETRAVLLRLTKDSQEAGFLTSFCPIVKFPTVVVIKNGMLCDYLVPEISDEDFRSRLAAKLNETQATAQPDSTGASGDAMEGTASPPTVPVSTAVAPPAAAPAAAHVTAISSTPASGASETRDSSRREGKKRVEDARISQVTTPAATQKKPTLAPKQANKAVTPEQPPRRTLLKPVASTPKPTPPSPQTEAPQVHQPPSPPEQYRLQVRLFDGSSVRSSFSPSQTIRADVRPWLDTQTLEEKRPYNLKHILTPLSNRTLTIAEEEQSLAELGLGSSANLVMVPISTYTDAYSAAGSSLPIRAVSSAYGLFSSAVGTATGLVGSFLGYGSTARDPSSAQTGSPSTSTSSTSDADRRARPAGASNRGPIIRTLRDQRGEQENNQFYNGNQLNFQPRRDDTDRR
ncbi:hypothetical protein ASPACDRAFT_42193 [Aspergillus aculeatus ATCC 16872]|uniref:UBX domain-containing protein n=1 Tax=Aspergillus aculeatus (strain ATCC 16872 / CBS 172.66 / WB 5094) TaxID=690307 RepID=A0A1L9WWU9_ASPA1|nr:uncharacterized protein ASPACDRAFT_42193 [Aspergillus aculeatus ATCC 16872]OJK00702.1 hypothetical protein ASPACDRAFT_42193 [Aspergillus aculeatus ATCC 16872]